MLIKSLLVPQENKSNSQHTRWSSIYAGPQYYYGFDAGPVARRAVRYHRPLAGSTPDAPTALDVGCGEGQDVAFLCENGCDATGIDFVPAAIEKARRLLKNRNLSATLQQTDLREWNWSEKFDLVLAVNSLQFLGEDAPAVLQCVLEATRPGGVLGISLFACEEGAEVQNETYFTSLENLLARFHHEGENRQWQIFEASKLWQWNARANAPQPFITLIAQRLY